MNRSPGAFSSRRLLENILPFRIFPILALIFSFSPAKGARAQEIRIAAASDLRFAMQDLAASFEKDTGTRVDVTYESSGNIYSQLQNAAPFDLFFSADSDYPKKLEAAGLIMPGTLYVYAVGRIVIWTRADAKVDLPHQRWDALLDPSVQKIAIANPEYAPYGRAAVAALRKAGVYDRVKSKLVLGQSVSQAAQFVQSGSAQVGILAESFVKSPAMKDGKSWEVPWDLYPPLEQAAVVLKSAAHTDKALSFLQFVKGSTGRSILDKYGFYSARAASRAGTP